MLFESGTEPELQSAASVQSPLTPADQVLLIALAVGQEKPGAFGPNTMSVPP